MARMLPSAAVSSRATTGPGASGRVLCDAGQLRSEQVTRGVKRGAASSVIKQQRKDTEIYPTATNPRLAVTSQQAETPGCSLPDSRRSPGGTVHFLSRRSTLVGLC
jgi:hypothetical protein